MPHTLLATLDELIAPETLSRLCGQPVTSRSVEPLQAAFAKSGSRLLRIETNGGTGPRFVVKQVAAAWDWLMRATDDHRCRSVTLWQHGILARMPPEIAHGVLACARDGDGWAILMRDHSAVLVANQRFGVADHQLFVEAMAAMHATFWQDHTLLDATLGLCGLPHVYGMFAPQTGQREADGPDEIPRRIGEGWPLALRLVAPDVARVVAALLHDPTPLCDALNRYPHTLIHGDWRHANQGILRDGAGTPQVLLLDWQLAAVGPPAVELGRYLGANGVLLPGTKAATLAAYRHSLAQRLGTRFSDEWWQPQLALGLLGGFVQDGWAMALKATTWHVGADARDHWRADLAWWAEQVRAGARWL